MPTSTTGRGSRTPSGSGRGAHPSRCICGVSVRRCRPFADRFPIRPTFPSSCCRRAPAPGCKFHRIGRRAKASFAGWTLETQPLRHHSGEGRSLRALVTAGSRLTAPDGAVVAYVCDHQPSPRTVAVEDALVAQRGARRLRWALLRPRPTRSRPRVAGIGGCARPQAPRLAVSRLTPRPEARRQGDSVGLRPPQGRCSQLRHRPRG